MLSKFKLILISFSAITGKAISAIWTFPSIFFSAYIIAWAAETAQFFISQGLALALLAWLQTLPEFAVEAVIAWEAGKDPAKVHLVTANFTGSLRILVGLGWPMIYLARTFLGKKHISGNRLSPIKLEDEHSIEVMGLLLPLIYFVVIYLKGTLNLFDSVVLVLIYLSYLYILNRMPPQETEKVQEACYVTRKIMGFNPPYYRYLSVFGLFLVGGTILYFAAEPFLQSMLGLAALLAISDFVFVQWVAPFLSEFPEYLSAFNWARTGKKAPMALMNVVSSNINQWTVLVAMIPIVYSLSAGGISTIHFDHHQKVEILLTIAQSALGFLLLANMEFHWYEALTLFVLWFSQFIWPSMREEITVIYFVWIALEVILGLLQKRQFVAFEKFGTLMKKYVLRKK
jgi:cation:H+ antiporter